MCIRDRQVYSAEGVLQKPVLAQFLLAGEANKQAVNDVVHPAVARDLEQSSYEWMESAIPVSYTHLSS